MSQIEILMHHASAGGAIASGREPSDETTHRLARPGEFIMRFGGDYDADMYLLEGTVRLTAPDGKTNLINSESPSASYPIARLRPCRYDVEAVTNVKYAWVNRKASGDYPPITVDTGGTATAGSSPALDGYTVEDEIESCDSQFEGDMAYTLIKKLDRGDMHLPSLPDTAVRIRKAIDRDAGDARTIARIIQSDPAITAKVIRAANSSLYGRSAKIDTCLQAVVRLGIEHTHKLVLSFTMKELFTTDIQELSTRMAALWRHSAHVAAICNVLARHFDGFDPDQAMLAGLLHDIGVIPVLDYTRNHPEILRSPTVFDRAIERLRSHAGKMILKRWGLPDDICTAAEQGENWMRDHGGDADYCDLVIIAQIHSFIEDGCVTDYPSLVEIPAIRRLGIDEFTPRFSLQLLIDSREEVDQIRSLLTAS